MLAFISPKELSWFPEITNHLLIKIINQLSGFAFGIELQENLKSINYYFMLSNKRKLYKHTQTHTLVNTVFYIKPNKTQK